MKFEHTKENEDETRDTECFRKFLAGNKTLYTKAFWDNGPRRREQAAKSKAAAAAAAQAAVSRN